MIIEIEQRYFEHVNLIEKAIANSNFDAYNRVFNQFNFETTTRALLLFNIYPFDKFLVNGRPLIEREENHEGKVQKRVAKPCRRLIAHCENSKDSWV
ncbi:MAG: hypothetical protein AAF383_16845 [Cyanobacteria bacterium P01_A01_bin.83]